MTVDTLLLVVGVVTLWMFGVAAPMMHWVVSGRWRWRWWQ